MRRSNAALFGAVEMSPTIQDTMRSAIADAREGDVLAGKYRIESVLGHGGMGVVVAARHLQLDERVAIKFLLPAALERPEAVMRFVREAKAAIRIKSEHVVRVSDVGTLENGAPYMVMEYLEGTDLSEWLRLRGVMAVELLVEFVLQALEAIAEAHALRIIHRDLKPANLFCIRGRDGLLSVKVLDFGISKLHDGSPSGVELQVTAAAAMGSPLYMSPEQMRSARDVDARADIWSIGVIMYELLTGTPPFRGESLSEICVRAASFSPPPMCHARPDLPLELRAVVLKCLEKNPKDRFSNVAELANALLPFASRRARASVERIARIISNAAGDLKIMGAGPISSGPCAAVSNDGVSTRRSGGSWTRLVVPSIGVCTLVGGVLWAALDSNKKVDSKLPNAASALVITRVAATPTSAKVEIYPVPGDTTPGRSASTASASASRPRPTSLSTSRAIVTAKSRSPKFKNGYNAGPSGSGGAVIDPTAAASQPAQDPDLFNSPH